MIFHIIDIILYSIFHFVYSNNFTKSSYLRVNDLPSLHLGSVGESGRTGEVSKLGERGWGQEMRRDPNRPMLPSVGTLPPHIPRPWACRLGPRGVVSCSGMGALGDVVAAKRPWETLRPGPSTLLVIGVGVFPKFKPCSPKAIATSSYEDFLEAASAEQTYSAFTFIWGG